MKMADYHDMAIWNVALDSNAVQCIVNGVDSEYTLLTNAEDYQAAANLRHWWRSGYNATDLARMGQDYASYGTINTTADVVGIDTGDVRESAP